MNKLPLINPNKKSTNQLNPIRYFLVEEFPDKNQKTLLRTYHAPFTSIASAEKCFDKLNVKERLIPSEWKLLLVEDGDVLGNWYTKNMAAVNLMESLGQTIYDSTFHPIVDLHLRCLKKYQHQIEKTPIRTLYCHSLFLDSGKISVEEIPVLKRKDIFEGVFSKSNLTNLSVDTIDKVISINQNELILYSYSSYTEHSVELFETYLSNQLESIMAALQNFKQEQRTNASFPSI